MIYISCLFTFAMCFLFNPVYDNYTSLLNSQYMLLFFIWILIIDISLLKAIEHYAQNKKEKKFLYLLSLLFIIGSYLPYNSSFYLLSFFHVILPMITIILYILYIFYIIFHYYKKEPLQAHQLYQWYFWGLSIIAIFIIFFGQINGIIEITTYIFIIFMLKKLKIINDS